MLKQGHRRYWYDGWQITAGIGSALGAITATILTYPPEPAQYLLPLQPELIAGAALGGLIPTLLWLPIAWATWRPYVPTKPGLDNE